MKYFLKNLVSVAFLLGGTFAWGTEPVRFKVKGVHCGGCKKAIESAVCNLDFVQDCKVSLKDLKKQVASVELTAKEGMIVDSKVVKDAITEAGYNLETPKK